MSESSLSSKGRGAAQKSVTPRTSRASRAAPKKKRAGDKRDRILQAAVKVFAKNGFHATRVSEVAKAAGVADGTIYLYFKSKEELLISLFEDRVQKLLVFMKDGIDKEKPPSERLRAVIDMQLGLVANERELAEVITVILRQSARLMKEFAQPHFLAYLEAIASIISEGQSTGAFRDDISASVAARAVFGALDGITLTWALGRAEQGALARAATQFGDIILRGLAPSK